MKIAKGSAVQIDYKLHLGDGDIVDASSPGEPFWYLHGEGQIVPGLESALEGLGEGESKQVVVAPADAYGERDPERVQEVPPAAFPADVKPEVGMTFVAEAPSGEALPLTVREIRPDAVVVDLNHPLAGQTLHFDVTVRGVRAATPEELQHGHVHGPGAHSH